jgi:hypothetical protein
MEFQEKILLRSTDLSKLFSKRRSNQKSRVLLLSVACFALNSTTVIMLVYIAHDYELKRDQYVVLNSTTVNRGGNYHFSVRSIYFSGYSESNRRKTNNSHFCAVKLINDDFPYLFTHNEAKQKDINGIFLQKNLNFKNVKYVL